MTPTSTSPLVQALRGTRPERTPVWFMGQAAGDGAEVADGDVPVASLLPDGLAQRTLEPVRTLGVDAAIFAADIVTPMQLAGVDIEIVAGVGPVVAAPIRRPSEVLRLRPLDPEALEPIREAVAKTVAALGDTPLIGLGGAPYTLASYLIEGGPSRERLRTRAMMYAEPHAWATLLNWCADVTGDFLRAQIEAGASAVQLDDPAVGTLSRNDYFKRVVPHSQRALSHLRGSGVAIIHAGNGTSEFLDVMAASGVDAVGVDWRIPLDEAARRVGTEVTLQGNLDPALLAAPWHILRAHIEDVLERGRSARAHVVNLGADVPAGTDPGLLARIARVVHGEEPVD